MRKKMLEIFHNNRLTARFDSRSLNTYVHTILNVLFRGGTIALSFLLVPITLNYLDESNYGIWLTLNSIVGWFTFFDMGLGNGLKNGLALAFASRDQLRAKVLVSTAYLIIAIIVVGVVMLFLLAQPFLNWTLILNADGLSIDNLDAIAIICIVIFCFRLVFELIFNILAADQRTGYASLITFLGSLGTLVVTLIITAIYPPSIMKIAVAALLVPLIVSCVATFYLFATRYKAISPSVHQVNLKEGKGVMLQGGKFLVIQLAVLVIFSTGNVVISQLYGPAAVTDYNIVFKYFSAVTVLWNIFLLPYWTAFGNAYFQSDLLWIEKTMRMLTRGWLLLAFVVLLLLFASPWLFEIWIGDGYRVSWMLPASMALFVLINTFSALFVTPINGTGKVAIQFYCCIAVAIFNIPLSIFLAKMLNLGPVGVVLGNCIALCASTIINFVQYKKIVSRTDFGIWGR